MKRFSIFILLSITSANLSAQDNNLKIFFEYFMKNEYDSARVFLERKIQEGPDNPHIHFYLGKTYMALRLYDQAIAELQQALQNNLNEAQIYYYLGQAHEEQGMMPKAIEAYRSSIKCNPRFFSAKLELASLYYKHTNYEASISILKRILSEDSTHVQAFYQLGRCFMKKAKYDSAIYAFTKAVELDTSSFQNHLNLGIAHLKFKQYQKAAMILGKMVKINPTSDAVRFYLGETYANMKQYAKATEQLQVCAALNGTYRLESLRRLVEYFFKIGAYQDCIRLAGELLSEDSDDLAGHYYLALALSEEHEFEKADEEFEKVLKLTNLELIKDIYLRKGLNSHSQKDYPKAIRIYKKIISIDPNFSTVYYNLAVVYDEYYEDKKPALTYYQKFLTLAEKGQSNPFLIQSARKRLAELKEHIFFKVKR